jgi:polyferredoxin
MIILMWIIAAYGMTNILVYGSIFNGLRNWIHKWGNSEWYAFHGLGKFLSGLISCVLCTSTWVGFFLSLTFYSPSIELMNFNPYFSWFFDGCLASGAVWGINALVEYWEGNRHTN